MQELELLKRRIDKEQKARKQAEGILEEKALALHVANEQLKDLNGSLVKQVQIGISELQKTEKRYQDLIESVQDIIYKISPDGYFTFVNRVVENRLGYTENEIIGSHFTELILPEYVNVLLVTYREMIKYKIESSYNEFPIRAKDGRTVWIGQTVRLIQGENTVLELVAVARDISDMKATQDSRKAKTRPTKRS